MNFNVLFMITWSDSVIKYVFYPTLTSLSHTTTRYNERKT